MVNTKPGSHRFLFILDEPTTGLHFHDIKKILPSVNAFIEQGHLILVIELSMDIIRNADWIIDPGPGEGDNGGNIVFAEKKEGLKKIK